MQTQQQQPTKISNIQFFIIFIASTTAFGHFVDTHLAILDAGRDAWISLVIGMAIGAILFYLRLKLATQNANLTLVKYNEKVFGTWIGGFISVLYIAFFIMVIAVTMKVVVDFMSIVYPTTPSGIFMFALLTIASWASYKGIEVISRTIQILLPVLMALGLLASLLSIQDKDAMQLLPILNNGWSPVLSGTMVFITMMSELVVFRTMTNHVVHPDRLPGQGLIATGILLVMFIGPVSGPVMLFGEHLAQSLAFPTYTEIQYIHLGDIIERFDIVGVLLWTIGSFFRLTTYLFAAAKSTADLIGSRESTLVIPVAVLGAAASMSIMQASREDVYVFLGATYMYIALLVGIVLPLVTALVDWLKGGLKGAAKKAPQP